VPRFRIDSEEGARAFRLRKSFLGTSRMTIRAKTLSEIGRVPETLGIQADEYLFTLAALSGGLILRESLTYYRLHEANAFQIGDGNFQALRRKRRVLAELADSLRAELKKRQVPERAAKLVVESVQTEADLIRLGFQNGWPAETLRTEVRNYRIMHERASLSQWLVKCVTLLPACVLPSRLYYSLRHRVATNGAYLRAREKWLRFPEPPHVDRYRTTRP
jgi:hypothetical protein